MTALNDPSSPPVVRQPRLRVLSAGAEIPGPVSFSVTNNSFFQCDTFRVQFAVSAETQAGAQQYDLNWWGQQGTNSDDPLLLDIGASLDNGNSFKSLILGMVDRLTIDPIQNVVLAEGRDLTAKFVDARTRTTYQNKTSSQIVEQLAASHGMTADATPTSADVGRFYSDDHTRTTLNSFTDTTTEWDLLTFLAGNEGFDVWVTGTTLHFHPSTPPNSTPYDVWVTRNPTASNATSLRLQRSLSFAKDIVVKVRSWNSRQKSGYTVQSGSAKGSAQEFAYIRPNLNGDQAQQLANQIRADISKQERTCVFELPGDLIPGPRDLLRLRGTNSSFDQTYFIDSVTRSMSFQNGFRMTVHVKNHSTESQVVTP